MSIEMGDALPLEDRDPPALLVLRPGAGHGQAPVHVQQGAERVMGRLRGLLASLSGVDALPAAQLGYRVGSLRSLIEACRRFQQQGSAEQASASGLHLGVGLAGEAGAGHEQALQRTACVARHAPLGTVGLQAEAVDALDRVWELPLVDLGEVQCSECGDAVAATKVLALTASADSGRPDPVALRNVLVVLTPQLDGGDAAGASAVAELVADTIATALTRSALVRVVARESARRLREPQRAMQDAYELLQASHVLHSRGQLGANGLLLLQLELLSRGQTRARWSQRLSLRVEQLLAGEVQELIAAVTDLHASLVSEALNEAQLPAWQNLADHQLLMAASQLMHRLSPASFERSRLLLEELARRQPQQALVHAWRAKWSVMATVQGIQPRSVAVPEALAACAEALRRDPHCALALALDGYAQVMEGRPLAGTRARFEAALDANPNEAFAWLFSAMQATFEGDGERALQALRVALALSPLDPWRYLFDAIAAHVHLARGEDELALAYAQCSARLRARHAPTLFYLVVAEARLGRLDRAHAQLRELQAIWPRYSLHSFWSTYAGRDTEHAKDFAWALTAAGLPG